jgi:tetratricopeptide (TPR) repeat protein
VFALLACLAVLTPSCLKAGEQESFGAWLDKVVKHAASKPAEDQTPAPPPADEAIQSSKKLFNEAIRALNQHDYDQSAQILHEAIALDPEFADAYELLGEIANLKHEVQEAEEYYRKAYSIKPNPILKDKIDKMAREQKIDQNQQEYADEHFIIRYKRREGFEGSKIRDFLRDAYREVSQDFGVYPKYKIPVVLYDRTEYQKLMGSVPHWSGALFDGKIRLPVYEGNVTEVELKRLIQHELTHSFVLDLSKMECPIWLNEGIAQYQENKVKAINLLALELSVKKNSLLTLNDLMDPQVAHSGGEEQALLYYLESFSFVAYLLQNYRWYHLKQFLAELGNKTSFPEAFEKVFGRSAKDFEAEWIQSLRRRYAV